MATPHVYVIGPLVGFPVKIGVANNPHVRCGDVQVGCWEELFVHSIFESPDKGAAHRLEKLCHKRLKDHLMQGEWFNIMASDAETALDELCRETKYGRKVKNFAQHNERLIYIEKLESAGWL